FINTQKYGEIIEGIPRKEYYKDMQANQLAKCYIYYFTVNGISWEERIIKGITYNYKTNKWESRKFPFPNIIYDCGVRFKPKLKAEVGFIRQQMRETAKVRYINNVDYLGKWELYEALRKYPKIAKLLP